MKGSRDQYNDLKDDESFFDFYERHTYKEDYSGTSTGFNHLSDYCQNEGIEIDEVGDKEARRFCIYLKEEICGPEPNDLSEEVAEIYVEHLSRMFKWLVNNTNYIDWEPFDDALENSPFDYDDRSTSKRDISLDNLRQAILNIKSPSLLTLVVLLLKTGLRVGEASNLIYRDIHLDHPVSEQMPEPRAEIKDTPDAIYVDSARDGNKPDSYREIPIDSELKSVLAWYISLSPPSTGAKNPLLINLTENNAQYNSVSVDALEGKIRKFARQNGWHSGGYDEKNVTPHWFRHWFTTLLRANIDDSNVSMGGAYEYVQGLRGDTGSDVIDTYSHRWESIKDDSDPAWREIYCDAMPSLLVKPDDADIKSKENSKELKNTVSDFLIE